MPGQKGTLWNEFEEGGKYKTNKTHKEAWCKWCINAKAEELYQKDTLAREKDATVLIRTRGTLCVEAHSNISPICGKPEKLRNHIASGALAHEEASQYVAYQPYSINDIFDFSKRKRPL